jgi:hypothetical protein
MSTSEITLTRSDFLAAGLALDAAMEANGGLVDILSEVYQVFFNHVVEVRLGLTTDVTTWLDGHVPEDIKDAPFLKYLEDEDWPSCLPGHPVPAVPVPAVTIIQDPEQHFEYYSDDQNSDEYSDHPSEDDYEDSDDGSIEWGEHGPYHAYSDDDISDYRPEVWAQTDPAAFAATCQAIENAPGSDLAWSQFRETQISLRFKKIKPWDFLAGHITPAMKDSLLLKFLFADNHTSGLYQSDSPVFTPDQHPELGTPFIEAMYKAHLELSADRYASAHWQGAGEIVFRGILIGLINAKVHVHSFLAHWLAQPHTVPQDVVEGPGIFRIVAHCAGKHSHNIVNEIDWYYRQLRQSLRQARRGQQKYTMLVNSFTVVDAALVANEQCPACWCDFCEDVPGVDTTPVKTPCGHLFMKGCLMEALKTSDNDQCPYCRQKLR